MADQAQRRPWLRALNVASFAVGGLALALLLHKVGVARMRHALAGVGYGFGLICLVHLADIALDSVILRACAAEYGDDTSYWLFLSASLSGHAINEAVPTNSVGEVTKFNLLREHMPGHAAAAALIVQNLVRFIVTAAVIAVAAPVAVLWLEPTHTTTLLLAVASVGFAAAGGGCVWLLLRGIGDGPLRLARKLGLSAERVDRWRTTWAEATEHWNRVTANRRRMRTAWLASVAARVSNVVQSGLILHFLGVSNVVALAILTAANYQVVVWATSFVPFQLGTTEGGAYFLYRGVGASAQLGVIVELVRRARRLVFIALGVALLAVKTLTPPRSEGS